MKMGWGRLCYPSASSPRIEAVDSLGASSPPVSLARASPRTRNCRPRPSGEHAEQTVCFPMPSGGRPWRAPMDILYPRCAGIDVHKNTVVVAVRCAAGPGPAREEVRTFATLTGDLLALADWLAEHAVTHVAMESTGVYWKPVFNLLEGRFGVILVNAEHIKQVPGRKTDVKDCQWIPQLLQHGLLRASFVPPEPIRGLRDLTRQRTQLTAERAAAANRIQKVLADANIKLASVATDVLGVSGRAMLEALTAGVTDPEQLAELARMRLRAKIPELQRALQGRVTEHHRF